MPLACESVPNTPSSEPSGDDTLLSITIDPPLPCGIANCGQPAHQARVERDSCASVIWNLLPICDAHLASLAATAAEILQAPYRPHPDPADDD